MKKIFTILIIFNFIFINSLWAFDGKPCLYKSSDGKMSFIKLCDNVQDIICKDVNLAERRSCNERDQTVFKADMTNNEMFNVIKSCFGGAATSFKQFFTEFIPDLLKAIWNITKDSAQTFSNSFTGNGPNVYDKLKGAYESIRSVSTDIYEAVSENPSAFMSKLWGKINDSLGPLVANFDCLKPDLKVSKVCGFVAEWVIPPVILAKMLVKGTKLLKAEAAMFGFANNEKKIIQYAKAVEKLDEATIMSMKFEGKYRSLGYTKEEFDQIIKNGTLKNFKFEELKPATSKDGWQQRKILLAKAAPETKPAIKAAIKGALPEFISQSDYLTVKITRANGEVAQIPAEIVERIIIDGKESAYRIRVYDPVTGKMKEAKMTAENMMRLNPEAAGNDVIEKMAEGHKKNPQFKSPQEEFLELQKKYAREEEASKLVAFKPKPEAIKPPVPKLKTPDGMEVQELAADDPKVLEAFGKKKANHDAIEFVPDPKFKNLTIIKDPEPKHVPSLKPKPGVHIVPHLTSDYVSLMYKNSMGITTKMNAQVIKKVSEAGKDKFILRIWDSTSQTFMDKKFSTYELQQYRAIENPAAEKELKRLNKSGYGTNEPSL